MKRKLSPVTPSANYESHFHHRLFYHLMGQIKLISHTFIIRVANLLLQFGMVINEPHA